MQIQFDLKLSKSQQEVYDLIHDDRYKFYTVVFSRQAGKSTLMEVLVIEWLLEKFKSIAYVCRNYILAKKLYRELIRIIPAKLIKTQNGSDLFIESIYGSTLNLFSAESGASLRGQSFHYLILDEFAFHKMEQPDGTHLWNDILSPTMKAKGKKCIFVSTPLGKNNMLYEMYQRGLSSEYPKYVSILKTIYDDGFVTPEEIDDIKKSIPDLSFRQEYMCEWLDDALSFFNGFSECFDITKYNDGRCYMGIDLSGDGQDATIVTKINVDGEVEQYEVSGTLDMKYRQIADIINNEPNLQIAYLENNGIGKPMILEISKLVKNKSKIKEWTTTNSSKEEIVSDLAVEIANKNVHFKKDDTKLFSELSNFVVSVSKSKKLTFAARGGGHDDRVLSLALALRAKKDYGVKYTRSFLEIVKI